MRLIYFLIVPYFLFSFNAFSYPLVPNQEWTKGSLCTEVDDDYLGYRYQEAIPYCKRAVSASTRARIFSVYRIPKACWSRYTIDHFIPLSIGGTNHPDNLWPEHKLVKASRRLLEWQLYWAMRRGEMTQEIAIKTIVEAKLHPQLPLPLSSGNCDCDTPDSASGTFKECRIIEFSENTEKQ